MFFGNFPPKYILCVKKVASVVRPSRGSSTWQVAPCSPWSGMLSRLAESCWEPPTLLTPPLAPSELTFATALTLLSLPTRRLLSGSGPQSSATGRAVRRTESMSRWTSLLRLFNSNPHTNWRTHNTINQPIFFSLTIKWQQSVWRLFPIKRIKWWWYF